MYKSPIEIMMSRVEEQLLQQAEDMILRAARGCGVNVDRQELLRALMYDREQYEKGYADGVRDATWRWIPTSERLPTAKDADERGNIIGRIPNGAVWMVWYKTVCSEPDMFSHWARMPELPEDGDT